MEDTPHKIVRRKQLQQYVGIRNTTLDTLIEKGEFPRPIPLGTRAVGWLLSEVTEWQRRRIAERDSGKADRSGLVGPVAEARRQKQARGRGPQ
jgi:prophage regulatory protein